MRRRSSRDGRFRWWVEDAREDPDPLLERLIADPMAVLAAPDSTPRTRVGRKRFYRVAPAGERPLYVKLFTLASPRAHLSYLARPSKARREAAVARRVAGAGFEVAGPVAVGEERRLGLLLQSVSAVPEAPGRDLRALLTDPATSRDRRRRLLLAFARLARRLHDAGVDQDDFSPNNFMATQDDELVLIDFERCSVGPPLRERRWQMLAKLARHELGVSRTDRLRFLRTYLSLGGVDNDVREPAARAAVRDAWTRIEAAFRRVRARDARHARRAAFRAGRRLRKEGAEWVVVGRESMPVIALELGSRARGVWRLAHQLERLRLPVLRPVRLRRGVLELEDPGQETTQDPAEAIRRARRQLEHWGSFTRDPAWLVTKQGALLRNPDCYVLQI